MNSCSCIYISDFFQGQYIQAQLKAMRVLRIEFQLQLLKLVELQDLKLCFPSLQNVVDI